MNCQCTIDLNGRIVLACGAHWSWMREVNERNSMAVSVAKSVSAQPAPPASRLEKLEQRVDELYHVLEITERK